MGKKYIIELEDKPFHNGNGDFLYRVKGFNSLVFDMTGVGKLTPYTEPDLEQVREEAYEEGKKQAKVQAELDVCHDIEKVAKGNYNAGLNDLWEAMQKAIKMYCEIDNEVFLRVFYDVKCDWGESVLQALFKNTPQHLIDSIRQYEQRQEESEEPKKEQSVTAEEVMRQYLYAFCTRSKGCTGCPLHTPYFTCGRGYYFLGNKPVADEEVRRAYAAVIQKMKEES